MSEPVPEQVSCSYCTFSASWVMRSERPPHLPVKFCCYGHLRNGIVEMTAQVGEQVQVWAFRPRPVWNKRGKK